MLQLPAAKPFAFHQDAWNEVFRLVPQLVFPTVGEPSVLLSTVASHPWVALGVRTGSLPVRL